MKNKDELSKILCACLRQYKNSDGDFVAAYDVEETLSVVLDLVKEHKHKIYNLGLRNGRESFRGELQDLLGFVCEEDFIDRG